LAKKKILEVSCVHIAKHCHLMNSEANTLTGQEMAGSYFTSLSMKHRYKLQKSTLVISFHRRTV